jgi:peptidoglycan/LPS O-acetylase OafA/YrhL
MAREQRIPVGPVVASVGAVLLVVSLFLDWYETLTGWTVFEIVDLVLLSLALATIFSLLVGPRVMRQQISPGLTLIITIATLAVVVTQVLNDPPAVAGANGPEQDVGIWLALGGAALMVAGALAATTHVSLAVETRPREGPPTTETRAETEATGEAPLFGSGGGARPGRAEPPPAEPGTARPERP